MKGSIEAPQAVGRRPARVVLALVLVAVLLLLMAGGPLSAQDPGVIYRIYVTNLGAATFTVSWTTELPTDAEVFCGTAPDALASCGVDPNISRIHYVEVFPLSPETLYYFTVRSGTGTKDNGGVPFEVTTPPIEEYPPP